MEYVYKTDTESEDSSTESQKPTPQQFNQSKLNDLVRDLDLSKQAAEILAYRPMKNLYFIAQQRLRISEKEMNTSSLFLQRKSNLSTVTMYHEFLAN